MTPCETCLQRRRDGHCRIGYKEPLRYGEKDCREYLKDRRGQQKPKKEQP